MSIAAIVWAFDQYIKPSAAKFVLVALSDNADHKGMAWPSLKAIQEKTCLDRKTIIASLDYLEKIGTLLDTGERVGRTHQVKVYRLNGLDTEERRHYYVYRVSRLDTGEFYIGMRTTSEQIEKDSYLGSGKWPIDMQRKKVPLVKEILASFREPEEAARYESQAIRAALTDPLCKNTKNGTVPKTERFRFSQETVPFFPRNSPKNGTRNLHGTVKEPKPTPPLDEKLTKSAPPVDKCSDNPDKQGKSPAVLEILATLRNTSADNSKNSK